MPAKSGTGVSGKTARTSRHAVPRKSMLVSALLGGEMYRVRSGVRSTKPASKPKVGTPGNLEALYKVLCSWCRARTGRSFGKVGR